MAEFHFTVNGIERTLDVPPMTRLLDVLRYDLQLTGAKEGCGEGECGACSVLIDGDLTNSCLVPVLQAAGTSIITIEGLVAHALSVPCLHSCRHALGGKLQRAFLECGGAQCGICTPGMILAAVALLERHPHPTMEQIREGLAGNLCRCTGYMRIFESVAEAAKSR